MTPKGIEVEAKVKLHVHAKAPLMLREHLGDGELDGEKVAYSLAVPAHLTVEFKGGAAVLDIRSFVQAAAAEIEKAQAAPTSKPEKKGASRD